MRQKILNYGGMGKKNKKKKKDEKKGGKKRKKMKRENKNIYKFGWNESFEVGNKS